LPDVTVASGAMTGFRLRARLAIRGRQNSPKIGLFEPDTHRVVHVPDCRVHHPLINQVASVVRRALKDSRITCYSDQAHLGLARHLQVAIERKSQTAQVVLVANGEGPEPLQACFTLIQERLGDRLHSLWFNANSERGNVVLGSQWQRICGSESILESFGGATVHYPPGAFGQSNLEIAQEIIEAVRQEIPLGARVAEFYAGVGAIGLSVVDLTSQLKLNEVADHSVTGLKLGIAGLEASQREKITVCVGPAGAACSMADDMQIVIVDPPRKGLDAELRQSFRRLPPGKLIYVSCGLESLLDDAAALMADGAMRLESVKAFNLMPFTEHVETLAVFRGNPPAGSLSSERIAE